MSITTGLLLFFLILFIASFFVMSEYVLVRIRPSRLDFLVEDKQDVKIFGKPYTYIPEKSTLFYVSVGFNFTTKRNYSTKPQDDKTKTAFINYKD